MITQAELKELFHYDGKNLIWRVNKNRARKGAVAGSSDGQGYTVVVINRVWHKAHRLIWLYVHGNLPNDQIDHRNGIRDDNRIKNLRDVTQSVNQRNSKKREDNKSRVTGIGWHKASNMWRARITVNGKVIDLGVYADKAKAIAKRRMAEVIYGGFTERHGA